MTAPIAEHPAAGGIRGALARHGLSVAEQAAWNALTFVVRDDLGRTVLTVRLSREKGEILNHITDHRPDNRRGPHEHHFRYRDRQAGPIEKSDRQSMDASRTTLQQCVARYARPEAPPEPDVDALSARIREMIDADPEGAAETIARAIAEATDADKTAEIATSLAANRNSPE